MNVADIPLDLLAEPQDLLSGLPTRLVCGPLSKERKGMPWTLLHDEWLGDIGQGT